MAKSSASRKIPQTQATFRMLAVVPERGKRMSRSTGSVLFREKLHIPMTSAEMQLVRLIESVRPKSLRAYDQIPMRSRDLLRQAKLMAPYLAGKEVVFIGDYDCTSLLLGLLGNHGHARPSKMMLLDFDKRLLDAANNLAYQHSFDRILDVSAYNVFDVLPANLAGRYDWFYTNPPYGSHNDGASGRLFVTRGCELVRQGGSGCIILPYDADRPWTQTAMLSTQKFLSAHGWAIGVMLDQMHQYDLDDDKHLASALILVNDIGCMGTINSESNTSMMPYAGRQVEFTEIPGFYGGRVLPPYPRYIKLDGSPDSNWMRQGEKNN